MFNGNASTFDTAEAFIRAARSSGPLSRFDQVVVHLTLGLKHDQPKRWLRMLATEGTELGMSVQQMEVIAAAVLAQSAPDPRAVVADLFRSEDEEGAGGACGCGEGVDCGSSSRMPAGDRIRRLAGLVLAASSVVGEPPLSAASKLSDAIGQAHLAGITAAEVAQVGAMVGADFLMRLLASSELAHAMDRNRCLSPSSAVCCAPAAAPVTADVATERGRETCCGGGCNCA